MPERVLVTGVSGFLGGHVALALLRAGYAVRGSVREPGKAAAVRETLGRAGADLDRLEFVALDLREDAGWHEAVRGCRYLQHVASPLPVRMPRDRGELIRPAVEGTARAVRAALGADVERVVLTSSNAAIVYGHPAGRREPFTAADWSRVDDASVSAYAESKTRAELEAWALMEAAGRRGDLATVNPAVILGPLLDRDVNTSAVLIQRLLGGTIPAAPRFNFGIVDVRDVAALHLGAMVSPTAGGRRFPVSAGSLGLLELAQALRLRFPQYARQLPRLELPDWGTRLLALFIPELRDNLDALGRTHSLDSSAAEDLLGRPFIEPIEAAAATARSLVEMRLA